MTENLCSQIGLEYSSFVEQYLCEGNGEYSTSTTLLRRWINVNDVDSTSQQRRMPSGQRWRNDGCTSAVLAKISPLFLEGWSGVYTMSLAWNAHHRKGTILEYWNGIRPARPVMAMQFLEEKHISNKAIPPPLYRQNCWLDVYSVYIHYLAITYWNGLCWRIFQ